MLSPRQSSSAHWQMRLVGAPAVEYLCFQAIETVLNELSAVLQEFEATPVL